MPIAIRTLMVGTLTAIAIGVLVVLMITAFTGYFVAQEFSFMAVDRARLRARASAGDAAARRALTVTGRTSFMLSGAQLGITVTGLVVGYVAEPLIGEGLGDLFSDGGLSDGAGLATGTALALLLATAVQMVFGELVPKNLAIARPEAVARRLAWSTTAYLRLLGPIIRIFDASSNALLRKLHIDPVHDVEHSATSRDLEAIIDESRESGDLEPDLSTLLDRVLDFSEHPARAAMIPRPHVATVAADEPLETVIARMHRGHSRYPVVRDGIDDVIGVVHLRDLLELSPEDTRTRRASEAARTPLLIPDILPLPEVLNRFRAHSEEFALVLDEYGGLAGVITLEDLAEELLGEIGDEHDPDGTYQEVTRETDGWTVPGFLHVAEVARLLDIDLPHGPYHTIGGLAMDRLGRLPQIGDHVRVTMPMTPDADDATPRELEITVRSVERRVPREVTLRWLEPIAEDGEPS